MSDKKSWPRILCALDLHYFCGWEEIGTAVETRRLIGEKEPRVKEYPVQQAQCCGCGLIERRKV